MLEQVSVGVLLLEQPALELVRLLLQSLYFSLRLSNGQHNLLLAAAGKNAASSTLTPAPEGPLCLARRLRHPQSRPLSWKHRSERHRKGIMANQALSGCGQSVLRVQTRGHFSQPGFPKLVAIIKGFLPAADPTSISSSIPAPNREHAVPRFRKRLELKAFWGFLSHKTQKSLRFLVNPASFFRTK